MNTDQESILNEDQELYVADLLRKADVSMSQTKGNCFLNVSGLQVPIKVDDVQLLFIGARLLPNIVNYLVNILPQFIYPYIVAYLQELSDDDPVTINQLFDFLKSFENGNIFDRPQTQD